MSQPELADSQTPDAAVAVTPALPGSTDAQPAAEGDSKLERLLSRIQQLREAAEAQVAGSERPRDTQSAAPKPQPQRVAPAPAAPDALAEADEFFPVEPTTWEAAQLQPAQVESLCLKCLFAAGTPWALRLPNR